MSYYADHLAWQQRVNIETKQQSNSSGNFNLVKTGQQQFAYPELMDFLRSYGPGDHVARKFGNMVPTKTQNFGIVPKVGEQIVSGRHIRDKSMDHAFSRTNSFNETKSLHGYRGYKSKNYDSRSKMGKSESRGDAAYNSLNLRDNTVGPYTQQELNDETLSRAKMRNFNHALNNTVKQRYGAEKSVFSQKSKVMTVRGSQKMPPSIFGKPTFRDAEATKEIFRTIDERKATIDPSNPLSQLIDEVLEETAKADLNTMETTKKTEEAIDEGPDVIKEADEKFESISNRVGDQSVFTKMSNKTYISQLQKQLNDEKAARQKIESEMYELKEANKEIVSQLQSLSKGPSSPK